jgi:hypothetical protein
MKKDSMTEGSSRSLTVKRIVLYLFFIGFLALPILIKYQSGTRVKAENTKSTLFSLKQFGFYLEDVTTKAGIDFVHQSPRLDPELNHILPQIASMGASVSVVDFDGDGWNDFYMTSSRHGSKNALYHNEQDGTFTEMGQQTGIGDVNQEGTGVSMGAVWGDYDNDGYEDLFIYKWGKPILFKNIGGKKFEKVNLGQEFPAWINANAAVWFDYNSDGLLDLFVGGYYPPDIDLWNLTTTRIMPESFEYANNGGRNYLFENRGQGMFSEVAEKVGLTSTRWTLAAGAADLSATGYPDLIIANDYGVDEYYVNLDGERFEEAGGSAGLGFSPKSGMNVSFGDIQNAGSLGIYITNITQEGILLQGNNFWVRNESNNRVDFNNIARQRGIEMGGWSYGAQFGDLNNDGSQDLYVANGFISAQKGTTYWYDYSKVTGGNKAIISDAKNWPDMKGRSQSGYQRNKIWLNDGGGFFQEVAELTGDNVLLDSRSVVMVDLWNRGVLDIIVANQNSRPIIYKNTVDTLNNWIAFELTGLKSNKSAIGARVDLQWDGKIQTQVLTGGIGFCAQNQRRLHFGLGPEPRIEKVTIHWPSGKIQELRQPGFNRIHRIREEL